MNFDELALKASRHAAKVGAQAATPAFSQVLARHRAPLPAWLIGAGIAVAAVAFAFIWRVQGSPTFSSAPDASAAAASSPEDTAPYLVPASCPVTVPGDGAFTPASESPEDPPDVYNVVWFGSPQLWTMLDPDGQVWFDLPVGEDGSMFEKTFWWSEGYDPENPGNISVRAEQLGGSAAGFEVTRQAGRGFNPFMHAPTHESVTVIDVEIPEPGCWKLTAEYMGDTVSYVVWVSEG